MFQYAQYLTGMQNILGVTKLEMVIINIELLNIMFHKLLKYKSLTHILYDIQMDNCLYCIKLCSTSLHVHARKQRIHISKYNSATQ